MTVIGLSVATNDHMHGTNSAMLKGKFIIIPVLCPSSGIIGNELALQHGGFCTMRSFVIEDLLDTQVISGQWRGRWARGQPITIENFVIDTITIIMI